MNSPALITVAKETGQTAGTIRPRNILNMWSRFAAPRRERATWLCNEDAVSRIDSGASGGYSGFFIAAGTAGNARPLLKGRPVVTVEQSPPLGTPGDVVLAGLSQYCIVAKPDMNAVSVHVAFLNDQLVFLFVLGVDGKPKWVTPVTPLNSTATRSPLVALAQR